MSYLNKVFLIGNVGKDLDVHAGPSHTVARFSLATTRRYRDNNGEQKEQTDWHTIVAFNKAVETMQNLHVGKGTAMLVEGELHNRSWTDQATGQKRYATEVTMNSFQLLGSRPQNGNPYAPNNNSGNGSSGNGQRNTGAQQAPANDYGPSPEDDLPF